MSLVVGTNSWATVAEADIYFALHIESATWTALSTDDKNKYLVSAFRWVFNNPAFDVLATNSTQKVKDGQCEAALFLKNYYNDYSKRSALISSGVKSFKYGNRTETLGEIQIPPVIASYFDDYYSGGGVAVFEMESE